MRTLTMATAALAMFAAAPCEAQTTDDPPDWSAGGPYRLDLLLAVGVGARVDDPPRFEASSRAIPTVETGLDFGLSRRIGLWLHYQRVALAPEESGLLPTGTVRLERSVDALWAGLRVDPFRSDEVAGYLRLGAALAWQHVDLDGVAWSPVTPAVRSPLSCGGTGLGFAIWAALGVDVVVHEALRFVTEVGADNLRLSSELVGGCAPGAGTATVLGLRGGFVYGFPL